MCEPLSSPFIASSEHDIGPAGPGQKEARDMSISGIRSQSAAWSKGWLKARGMNCSSPSMRCYLPQAMAADEKSRQRIIIVWWRYFISMPKRTLSPQKVEFFFAYFLAYAALLRRWCYALITTAWYMRGQKIGTFSNAELRRDCYRH